MAIVTRCTSALHHCIIWYYMKTAECNISLINQLYTVTYNGHRRIWRPWYHGSFSKEIQHCTLHPQLLQNSVDATVYLALRENMRSSTKPEAHNVFIALWSEAAQVALKILSRWNEFLPRKISQICFRTEIKIERILTAETLSEIFHANRALWKIFMSWHCFSQSAIDVWITKHYVRIDAFISTVSFWCVRVRCWERLNKEELHTLRRRANGDVEKLFFSTCLVFIYAIYVLLATWTPTAIAAAAAAAAASNLSQWLEDFVIFA